jgi:hypothetical protein
MTPPRLLRLSVTSMLVPAYSAVLQGRRLLTAVA